MLGRTRCGATTFVRSLAHHQPLVGVLAAFALEVRHALTLDAFPFEAFPLGAKTIVLDRHGAGPLVGMRRSGHGEEGTKDGE